MDKMKNQLKTPPIETKNKLKNIAQMEIEMDSTPTIKKLEQFRQKLQASFGQAGKVHMNTKVNNERLGSTF